MQINLNENEIKQAITDYLSARLVNTVTETKINMTAGRAPTGFTATVDITFAEVDWMAEVEPVKVIEPFAPEVKKTVTKVVKPEVTPEPKAKEILKEVAKDLGIEANIGTETPKEVDPFNTDPAPDAVVETKVIEEEAPIVEGENVMTENFELATSADNVAAPIVDDVEDLFS